MAESPHIVSATSENFASLVLDASHHRPVLVDFWAAWCAPCRMLMPILAKLATEYGGKILVAKVNTDEERELATRYGIRSLPTVALFKGGQPLDQFLGALPEGEVRAFIDRHLPREADALLSRAESLLSRGDSTGAATLIAEALTADPAYPRAILADARLKARQGRITEAEATINRLPADEQEKPAVAALRGQLGFAAAVRDAPPLADLERLLQERPEDNALRYELAARRVLVGDYEKALELLLQLLLRDRGWGEGAARKAMLQIFDILGGTGELVSRFRNRMFMALH